MYFTKEYLNLVDINKLANIDPFSHRVPHFQKGLMEQADQKYAELENIHQSMLQRHQHPLITPVDDFISWNTQPSSRNQTSQNVHINLKNNYGDTFMIDELGPTPEDYLRDGSANKMKEAGSKINLNNTVVYLLKSHLIKPLFR